MANITQIKKKDVMYQLIRIRIMKDRPPWEAMRGSITWRKYGLRNTSRGQLEGDKEITCSKV